MYSKIIGILLLLYIAFVLTIDGMLQQPIRSIQSMHTCTIATIYDEKLYGREWQIHPNDLCEWEGPYGE